MVSTLASCTHSAARHWLTACADHRLLLEEGVGEELTWLKLVNSNTCGMKTDEICRKFVVVTLAISFNSGQKLWAPFQSRSLGTVVILAVWLILIDPTLPCS